jgi:hypothetical protein
LARLVASAMDDETESHPTPGSELSRHVPEGIRIYPNVWPGKPPAVQPGDVTQFVPMGFCFGGPIVMRPWDTLESVVAAGGFMMENEYHGVCRIWTRAWLVTK